MASLYKPTITTYVLPGGKHRTPDGRRVTKETPGAVKVSRKSKIWYGSYKAADGFRDVPLCADKTASKQILAKLAVDAKLSAHGLGDVFAEPNKRPLSEHLYDYRRSLEAEGNCKEYVDKTCARVQVILNGCGFVFVPQLCSEKVAEFLHGLRRDPPRPELPVGQEWFSPQELVTALGGKRPPHLAKMIRREGLVVQGNGKARRYPRATVETLQALVCRGIGPSTSNGYVTAIKGFSSWLVQKDRTDRDRLISLSRLNTKTDLRHERRALGEGELRAVLAVAGASNTGLQGLSGADRSMLYAVAMVSGLRASELASLWPGSFDLDGQPPTATVKAAYSKNRRTSVQPLPPDVAEALRGYLAARPAGQPVWPGDWHKSAAEMLRADLEAAGIPYRDADGRVCDFHALRHSFITLLERSGASPKLAQDLARHSDIRLTMNVYTHTGLYDRAGAVESLPPLLPVGTDAEGQACQATGTDGKAVRAVGCALGKTVLESAPSVRTIATGKVADGPEGDSRKTLKLNTLGNDCERMITDKMKLPGQDSNLDKENQNLLCYRYTTGYSLRSLSSKAILPTDYADHRLGAVRQH